MGNILIPLQSLFFFLRLSVSSRVIKSASKVFSKIFFAILLDFLERFAFAPASPLIVIPLRKPNNFGSPLFFGYTSTPAPTDPSIPEFTSVINSVVF